MAHRAQLVAPQRSPGALRGVCVLSALLAAALPTTLAGQGPLQSVIGTVRQVGERGGPLPDAEVVLGRRQARTDERGRFRIDSLAPGEYAILVRAVGYRPARGRVTVPALAPTEVEFFLEPAPVLLPDVVVEATRGGLSGVVRTRAFTPVGSATIEVVGQGGGQVTTDTLGRFEMPRANNGVYLVRVTHPGYVERRLTVAVEAGRGRELSIEMASGMTAPSRADAAALYDLRMRINRNIRRNLLAEQDLRVYGTLAVCQIPRVRVLLQAGATASLGGQHTLLEGELCTWEANELTLIELIPREARMGAPRVIIWPRR